MPGLLAALRAGTNGEMSVSTCEVLIGEVLAIVGKVVRAELN